MKHQARGQPTEQRVDELATPPGTDRVVDLPSLDEVFARRGVLVRLAYRLCWNIEDAEDAVQNALLLASEKRHQLADARRLWSWVRAIVVRQCHEVRRRLARQQRRLVGGDGVVVADLDHLVHDRLEDRRGEPSLFAREDVRADLDDDSSDRFHVAGAFHKSIIRERRIGGQQQRKGRVIASPVPRVLKT